MIADTDPSIKIMNALGESLRRPSSYSDKPQVSPPWPAGDSVMVDSQLPNFTVGGSTASSSKGSSQPKR